MSEYIILNCENCKKPVVKIHTELLVMIKKALHYDADHGPHLYHVGCPGGFEGGDREVNHDILSKK